MAEPSTDEADLIRRVRAGDEAAFAALYTEYYERLFRFIYRVTRSLEPVEELIQETLLVVWEKADSYDHSCKLSTWMFGIAYRKALKSLAKSSRDLACVDLAEFEESLADQAPCPAQKAEFDDWLGTALGGLPPDQRAVVELAFYEGLHYKDIALVLDCPENTVKTRMFHARKKLQSFAEAHSGGALP